MAPRPPVIPAGTANPYSRVKREGNEADGAHEQERVAVEVGDTRPPKTTMPMARR